MKEIEELARRVMSEECPDFIPPAAEFTGVIGQYIMYLPDFVHKKVVEEIKKDPQKYAIADKEGKKLSLAPVDPEYYQRIKKVSVSHLIGPNGKPL